MLKRKYSYEHTFTDGVVHLLNPDISLSEINNICTFSLSDPGFLFGQEYPKRSRKTLDLGIEEESICASISTDTTFPDVHSVDYLGDIECDPFSNDEIFPINPLYHNCESLSFANDYRESGTKKKTGNTSLKNCLKHGMYETACRLIELGTEIDEEDEDGLKELIWMAVKARGIQANSSQHD